MLFTSKQKQDTIYYIGNIYQAGKYKTSAAYVADTHKERVGLSLSYDIVKVHGGEIKVETAEGEYANFIVVLPLGI